MTGRMLLLPVLCQLWHSSNFTISAFTNQPANHNKLSVKGTINLDFRFKKNVPSAFSSLLNITLYPIN